ncbi:MAG: helix-turn-helix transcriptional regulator [Planctomycetota bacterium]|nr:helix-turn-helix transcriptional regulator [Planctomycetota bacterium]
MLVEESMMLTLKTPAETAAALAQQAKALRLLKGWTRATMAQRAGVTASSLKRFEQTGKASVELVMKIAHALGRLDEFDKLLQPPLAQSLAELEQRAAKPAPKRGRI